MGKLSCLQVFISEVTYNRSAVHVNAIALFYSNIHSLFFLLSSSHPCQVKFKNVFFLHCILLNLMWNQKVLHLHLTIINYTHFTVLFILIMDIQIINKLYSLCFTDHWVSLFGLFFCRLLVTSNAWCFWMPHPIIYSHFHQR